MVNCKICGQPVTCGLVVHDGCYAEMADENARLRAELEQVKAKLYAAVHDINSIANSGKTWMCPYCKHCKSIGQGFADCDANGSCKMPYTAFEWRGQKE